MVRPRRPGNRDLPPNLYPNRDGWKYVHPLTRKCHYWRVPKAKAVEAARKLNALLVIAEPDLVESVVGCTETVSDALRAFRAGDMAERQWAEKTRAEYEWKLARIEANIGNRQLVSMGVRDCVDFLQSVTESARARQQYRILLIWIFGAAVEQGWIESNPAAVTRAPVAKRQRERLTLEAYHRVRDNAAAWLQNAMDLSLHTLLRREDICALRFADVHDGAIFVVPSKTEGSTRVRLRIGMSPAMVDLVARCRDAVVSPYVIHRLPEKARPMGMRAAEREHHTQVLPEQLSRAFADARDRAGGWGDHPPTFHEIRSLGGDLYRQAGWTLQQVQALMGHASEAMTRAYLEGHEAPWTDISAGITL